MAKKKKKKVLVLVVDTEVSNRELERAGRWALSRVGRKTTPVLPVRHVRVYDGDSFEE